MEDTDAEVVDNRTGNNVVIDVFEAKTVGEEDDTTDDVVIFDEAKAEKFKEYFEYELTEKQRKAVEILLEHGDVIISSSHSLAITYANVQSIIEGLPDTLLQERKDTIPV